MRSIIKNLGKLITGSDAAGRAVKQGLTTRDLIRLESKIGAQLFGPIPKGHRREFFCLDEHTWIWHEEWADEKGKQQSTTVRYEIRSNGILKIQDGQPYQEVEGEELQNFALATRMYREHVLPKVYGRDAVTGQALPKQ